MAFDKFRTPKLFSAHDQRTPSAFALDRPIIWQSVHALSELIVQATQPSQDSLQSDGQISDYNDYLRSLKRGLGRFSFPSLTDECIEPEATSLAMSLYEGVWYDHAINKLILTLNPNAAGFLTAAIVTWVHLVAASTWPICRFLLYLFRQNVLTNDVFHHQRQVMLRNSSGAAATACELISMAWKWRSYRVRSFPRVVIYLMVCVAISLTWTICGLYAPYIYTHSTSDVLLAQSPYCGWVNVSVSTTDPEIFTQLTAESTNGLLAANDYVQQCYGDSNTTSQCTDFPRQSLQFQISDGTCPFGRQREACVTENATTVVLDTGYLDSNEDFGINAPPSDGVQYRRVTTCSPVHSTDYFMSINTTGTELEDSYPPGEVLLRYMYGPYSKWNYTYQYQLWQQLYPIAYTLELVLFLRNIRSPPYDADELSSRYYQPGDNDTWMPNATFFDPDQMKGDASILFLAANNVKYLDPVYDPWFAAGIYPEDAFQSDFNETTNVTEYSPSYTVNVLACHELHQICLAGSTDDCTPLISSTRLINETARLNGLTNKQLAAAGTLAVATVGTDMSSVVYALGSSALLAPRTLDGIGLLQTSRFGKEQWRNEMANIFSIGLAQLQAFMLSFAVGPTNLHWVKYLDPPTSNQERYICRRQRVRDPQGYVNFDMTGLIVTVVGGVVLMALGLSFEELLGWIARRSSRLRTSHARWLAEGIFHLHKRTLEARGVHDWQMTTTTMPRATQIVDAEAHEIKGDDFKGSENEQTTSFLHGSNS